tara:strand:+ start:136 stop:414 length:279 start_codon:yes stop_codon:yes gene_type:complete
MIKTFTEAVMLWGFGASGSGVASIGLSEYLCMTEPSNRVILSDSTLLPLGLFIGGVVTTSVVVWKIATHAKSIEVTLKHLNERVSELEKRKR